MCERGGGGEVGGEVHAQMLIAMPDRSYSVRSSASRQIMSPGLAAVPHPVEHATPLQHRVAGNPEP